MQKNFTISGAALIKLIDTAYPRDDQVPPYGLGGPVLRWVREFDWVLINPQPFPPAARLDPIPARVAVAVRQQIARFVEQYQAVQFASDGESSEQSAAAVGAMIRAFVDDYCGTVPKRWPWPVPKGGKDEVAQPLDLLVAGAQFDEAAGYANPLQAHFAAAADQLIEQAVNRL